MTDALSETSERTARRAVIVLVAMVVTLVVIGLFYTQHELNQRCRELGGHVETIGRGTACFTPDGRTTDPRRGTREAGRLMGGLITEGPFGIAVTDPHGKSDAGLHVIRQYKDSVVVMASNGPAGTTYRLYPDDMTAVGEWLIKTSRVLRGHTERCTLPDGHTGSCSEPIGITESEV